MVTLIKDELNEFSYPAYLAGLNYELYKHLRGVTIKISGYNDKQARLLQSLLEGIEASRFKDDRFQIYKARLIRSLHNAKQKKPFEQAISVAQRSILQPSWSEDERITALEGTDLTDLNNFKNDFFKQLDIAMLSTGNVTKEDSLAAATLVQTKLLSNAQRTHVARAQINELTGDQGWIKTFSVDHPDTGFVHYLQGDNRSFSERARFSLLAQLLSTDYYTAIRTEQQLGYIVFATNFSLLEVPALAFIIQSPTADGETLFTQTRQFLINYLDTLTELSDEDLARVKASVISRLSEKDNKLYQRTNRYWQEMDQENFDFNTREQLIAEVEKIDKPELISFYQKLIQKHGKGLTVFTSNNEEYASPEDLSEFTNASLDVFK